MFGQFEKGHIPWNKKLIPGSIPEPTLCLCNCNQYAKPGKKYIYGHNRRGCKPTNADRPWNLGLTKETDERVRKNGESGKGKHNHTEEWRKNHSKRMKGRPGYWTGKKRGPIKEGTKKKLSEANKGQIPWIKGKHHTEETKKIISIKRTGWIPSNSWIEKHSGPNHPLWNDGSSFEPYGLEFNKELKKRVREKFNHVCILCKEPANIPHHIDYNKQNNFEDNFVLLCKKHHTMTNHNRDQWETGFKLFMTGAQS